MKQNKLITWGLATSISVALMWLVMAADSGMFIPHDERWAVEPGAVTDDGFSHQKEVLSLPSADVAYIDVGEGPPLILLHGCPFSVYEWKEILPELSKHYRVIAPDLFGLGDTPVRLNQDYRLPTDVTMVNELMDALDIPSASFITHDHGGATLQLMMKSSPERIDKAIMTNVEAYDQWPSIPELPYLRAIVNPITSPLMFEAMQFNFIQRKVFSIAYEDDASLTPEIAHAFAMAHAGSAERWQRLRRFFTWQMDENHNDITMTAVPAMRAFKKPMLLIWGQKDENFGPELAYRLANDIPGIQGISFMKNSQHMPMQEESEAYAETALAFLMSGTVSLEAANEATKARTQGSYE